MSKKFTGDKGSNRHKGQSTMEYVLLFAGLTLVAIYAVNNVIVDKGKNQANMAESVVNKATDELWGAVKMNSW